ncbi:hypothetical protein V6N12_035193 [Hibiscus sabdariffa]|uniref:RNase H type-1 domain-containing protein n=1 Tax=Hibiscus sabdariffa TaxID=183260 RepID=A0ABR1ZF60_9ROSI
MNLKEWIVMNLSNPKDFVVDANEFDLLFGVVWKGPRSWLSSDESWVKVNTDGTRQMSDGFASCGGVGRDQY